MVIEIISLPHDTLNKKLWGDLKRALVRKKKKKNV